MQKVQEIKEIPVLREGIAFASIGLKGIKFVLNMGKREIDVSGFWYCKEKIKQV
jgi:hypothetical protein